MTTNMKNHTLKAMLTHLTLTQGTWGDDDLFIGTQEKKDLVSKDITKYERI